MAVLKYISLNHLGLRFQSILPIKLEIPVFQDFRTIGLTHLRKRNKYLRLISVTWDFFLMQLLKFKMITRRMHG